MDEFFVASHAPALVMRCIERERERESKVCPRVRERGNKSRVSESMVIGVYCRRSTWEMSFKCLQRRTVLSGKSSVISGVFCKRERERGREGEGGRERGGA